MVSGNPNAWKFGFGQRPKEVDDAYRKLAKGVPKKIKWSKEKIHEFFDELLDKYQKILVDDDKIEDNNPKKLKQETIKDLNTMVRRLLEYKQAYYPVVQKSMNVEIDFNKMLEEWRNSRNELIVNPTEQDG